MKVLLLLLAMFLLMGCPKPATVPEEPATEPDAAQVAEAPQTATQTAAQTNQGKP